jgi:hypothetical protein
LEAIDPSVIVVGCINIVTLPLILWIVKRFLGARLDKFDEKRDEARAAQADAERKFIEQREAERTIILAMSRTMLLDNYEKCIAKGCYTLEEREVYHKLYVAYKNDGGNSIIDEIAPRIRALPMELPKSREA